MDPIIKRIFYHLKNDKSFQKIIFFKYCEDNGIKPVLTEESIYYRANSYNSPPDYREYSDRCNGCKLYRSDIYYSSTCEICSQYFCKECIDKNILTECSVCTRKICPFCIDYLKNYKLCANCSPKIKDIISNIKN